MKKTILDLWLGNISPMTTVGINDPEIKYLENLIYRNHEKLITSIDNTQKETLDKYTECMNDYTDLYAEKSFCYGFSLGIRFTAEALMESDE